MVPYQTHNVLDDIILIASSFGHLSILRVIQGLDNAMTTQRVGVFPA